MKRKSTGIKARFDVFKRDGFACQYCGNHPPAVVLQIDHIQPVAEGGSNDLDNLVTACQPCNAGKGARLLSSAPQSLANKATEIAEREAQLAGYRAVIDAKQARLESEMWEVAEILEPGSSESGFNRRNLTSIKRFLEKLDAPAVMYAAELAYQRMTYSEQRRFRYFCAVCWNQIRSEADAGS